MSHLIKTPEQINNIAESCRRLAVIFDALLVMVKPGLSTAELEETAVRLMTADGGQPAFKNYRPDKKSRPFPTALCVSLNDEIVHAPALPARELRDGDIVSIDAGLNWRGFFSDMARTLAVGKVSPAAKHLLSVTRAALNLGIKEMRPGNTLDDIGRAIQLYVEANGLSVVRDLVGHGVGLAVHEDPQIPHYAIKESGLPNVTLRPGMVLALEPMVTTGDWRIADKGDGFTFVTADHSLAAQFEDTIAITADGPRILTK